MASSSNDKPRVEKLSLKKKGTGSEANTERMEKADSDLQLYNNSERTRQLQKLKKRRLQGREDDVSCLQEFVAKLKSIFLMLLYPPLLAD